MGLKEILEDQGRAYDPRYCLIGDMYADEKPLFHLPGSIHYAHNLLLSDEPEHQRRAANIVEKVISLQYSDPNSGLYGYWPQLENHGGFCWSPGGPFATGYGLRGDFITSRLCSLFLMSGDKLDPELQDRTRKSLCLAAWNIDTKYGRTPASYTNIAIMSSGVCLMAGEIAQKPRLVFIGLRNLAKVLISLTYHGGFHEYNSPMYTGISLAELDRIRFYVRNRAARAIAWILSRRTWRTIADHYHPGDVSMGRTVQPRLLRHDEDPRCEPAL